MFSSFKYFPGVVFLILFSLLAYFGNYFSLPFFFGVDFIFGSIFVMLSIAFLGFAPGVLVAIIGGLYTTLLWGHPYALVALTAEAVFVGYSYRKISKNLVLIDFTYWFFIGAPLVLFFYTQQMGMNFDTASFIALKQALNGVFNTLIAGIIILLLQLKFKGLFKRLEEKISIKNLLFYVFFSVITLTAGAPIIYDGYSQKSEKEQALHKLLHNEGTEYFKYLEHYSNLKKETDFDYFHFKNMNFKLVEKNGNVVYVHGQMLSDENTGESLSTDVNGLYIWLPDNGLQVMKRWKTGIYYTSITSTINDKEYILTLEYPSKELVKDLESGRLKPFMTLNAMMLFGIIFSFFVSRWMSHSIREIANKSQKISKSIFDRENIEFYPSSVQEYDDLQQALQVMTQELLKGIRELKDLNNNLEQEVIKQTAMIQQENQRYETLMQYASEGVFILDLNGKVIEYSNVASEMLGYTTDEMKELYIYDWDVLHSREEALKHIKNTPYKPLKFETKHKRKDGSLYDASIVAVKIKLDDSEYIYASVRDITDDNRRALELSYAKDEAESASKSKSRFLANMSHEIRTPMTGLLGFISRLQKEERDPDRIKQFQIVQNSGETLLNLINDILDFSKIESGNMEIEKAPILLHSFFDDMPNVFQQLASVKNINLISSISENLPECILGDKHRLKQVLFNLISNAIKFTNSEGNVTLQVSFNDKDKLLYISVLDTGIGIAKENQRKIFDAFSQEDVTTTRKFGGTGLGLTISSRLIELMGGELRLESEAQKGSKFYFEIPIEICSPKIEDNATNELSEDISFKGHVLVVEDNKTNQMLMGMMLDDFGISYDIANDGAEGVLKCKNEKYDIVLMDENMPILNGMGATKLIRELEEYASVPIIAVTANALMGDKEKFLDAGMNDYISKPYSENDIKKILMKYLS